MSNYPNFNPSSQDTSYGGFNQIIKTYLNQNLFTVDIVKIQAINQNKVDVLPVIQQQTTDGKLIEITNNDIIANVPVLMLQGGNCQISFNLSIGDYGFLICCKKDCSNFVNTLKNSLPNSFKEFNLNNGFFLPFQIVNVNSSILIKNTNSQIEITPTAININAASINIFGNTNINGNTTTTKNNEATTYSTGGTAGISGTFIDTPTGKSITFTNGLITAQT